MKEKRRPTLGQLRAAGVELCGLECAWIRAEAGRQGKADVEQKALEYIRAADLTPEMVIELRREVLPADVEPAALVELPEVERMAA